MVGAEGKSMLGEAAGKMGFTRAGGAGAGDEGVAGGREEEEVKEVTVLRNRAGESRSPYVSFFALGVWGCEGVRCEVWGLGYEVCIGIWLTEIGAWAYEQPRCVAVIWG